VLKDSYVFLGYRFGSQHQFALPGETEEHSNTYNRLLAGMEGQVTGWLKLNLLIGPDWRNFGKHTAPGFDNDEVKLFIDSSSVITATKSDTVTLTVKRFEQPAFGSPSVYEDITYDVTWRHSASDKLTATAGFRAYCGDWEKPVRREDWIYTPVASLAYKHDARWSGDLSYSYDWADSHYPHTSGREFTRGLVSLSVKGTF